MICLPEPEEGDPEPQDVGIVTGYFQAHGFLGVAVRLDLSGETVYVFGTQVLENPEEPVDGAPS